MVQPYKVSVTTKTTVPITTKPSNITTFVPQENQKNTTSTTIQQIRLPWQINKETNIPGVTVNTLSKQGSLYKLKECASDGEPILKVVGVGITENPPTKCCEGLKLCSFLVTDEKEFIDYQGILSQIIGYCKTSCPKQDTTKDLLPNSTKPKTLLESVSDLFKVQARECYTNKDCENKYCIKHPSSFVPLGEGVSNSIIPLCNYYCSTAGKCEKLELGIITPNATSTTDIIQPVEPITDTSCKDSSDCVLCSGVCFPKNI